jgi:hypothetical protein
MSAGIPEIMDATTYYLNLIHAIIQVDTADGKNYMIIHCENFKAYIIIVVAVVAFPANRSRTRGSISTSRAGVLLEAMVAPLSHGLSESFKK